MKKVLCLLLLAVLFIIPFGVFAEDENKTEESKEVKVYFFRGEGCSHCAEAEEWFKSIEEEHGDRFEIIDYETWYDEDNQELMHKVASARGEEEQATGVPYIIVGDKSWVGFSEDYKDEILAQIDSVYGQEISERYDVMDLMGVSTDKKEEEKNSDVFKLIIILVAVGAIGFGVYKARSSSN